MAERLEPAEIERRLARLDGWRLREGRLHRSWEFRDFVEAFAFLTAVALLAEGRGHHPDIRNVYRRVELELTTHDAGGLTEADFDLAERIDRL